MPLSLSLGLGLSTRNTGGGYASQVAALRAFIQSRGSLVPATAASSPAITAGGGSPTLAGSAVSRADARIAYLGGHTVENVASTQPGTYPQNQFTTAKNLSFSTTERTTCGGIVEFDMTCPRFEVLEYQQSAAVRLLVDNQIAGSYTQAADGSLKYRLFDFTAIDPNPALRRIRLEYSASGTVGAIRLDTVGAMPTLSLDGYSITWLGDSFTEGTGAAQKHAALAAYGSKLVGFRDYRMSGFGGTGYSKDFNPGFGSTRPALVDRSVWDAVGSDVYVIAMGINDSGSDPLLAARVAATLDTVRLANPNALIFVLGAWGNGSGGVISSTVENIIQAAASGRPGVYFESMYGVSFSKSDATHPDSAGHVTLGTAVANRIKARVGL